MQLTITGYSTALFATWYFVEELGLLFDAGDGVSAALMQKSGKIRQVFISHADRDHVTGLLQLNQLNARPGLSAIYYPADSSSFPALRDFSNRFDPHVTGTEWRGLLPVDEIMVGKEWLIKPVRNGHVSTAGSLTKSLSYILYRVKHKLRAAYKDLPGQEIARLRASLGDDAVTEEVRQPVLAYSGDTPVEDITRYQGVQILIHEATFLSATGIDDRDSRPNKHSTLPEVMKMAASLDLQALILGHFSSRYSDEEIMAAVKEQYQAHQLSFPVFVVLPGQTVRNILHTGPVR